MYVLSDIAAPEVLSGLSDDLGEIQECLGELSADSYTMDMLRTLSKQYVDNPVVHFLEQMKNGEFDDVSDETYDEKMAEMRRIDKLFCGLPNVHVPAPSITNIVTHAAALINELDNIRYVISLMTGECVLDSELGPDCESCPCDPDSCPGCVSAEEMVEMGESDDTDNLEDLDLSAENPETNEADDLDFLN